MKVYIQLVFLATVAAITNADDVSYQAYMNATSAGVLSGRHCTGEAKYFPNIDWMLKGYNLMSGDPNEPSLDPGFATTTQIFDAQSAYKKNYRTGDCLYNVPDFMTVAQHKSCRKDMETKSSKTSLELSTMLSRKAKIGGGADLGVFKAKFSASQGFHASSRLFGEDATMITNTEAWCSAYVGGIEPNLDPVFTEGFTNALKKLPENYDERSYRTFIERYGTHYVRSVVMGAMYGRESEVTSTVREALAKVGISAEAGAEAAAKGVALEAKFSSKAEVEAAKKFNEHRTKTKVYSKGATLPKDGDEDKWFSQVVDTPTPLEYTLERLDNLKLPIDQTRKAHLTKALNGYCTMLKNDPKSVVGSCEEPPNRELPLPSDKFEKCTVATSCTGIFGSATKMKSAQACNTFCNQIWLGSKFFTYTPGYFVECMCIPDCDSTGYLSNVHAMGENKCPSSKSAEDGTWLDGKPSAFSTASPTIIESEEPETEESTTSPTLLETEAPATSDTSLDRDDPTASPSSAETTESPTEFPSSAPSATLVETEALATAAANHDDEPVFTNDHQGRRLRGGQRIQ